MRSILRIVLRLMLALLPATQALANFDTRPVDVFTIDNGLSQNSVWATAVDDQGFLWIGTEDGLNRFDGESFRIFRRDESATDTLADNFVTAVLAEGDSLYVATRVGSLQRFDLRRESFHALPESIDRDLRGNPIDQLLLVGERQLLVGTRDRGLFALQWGDSSARQIGRWSGKGSGLPNDLIRSMHRVADQGVWIGTGDGPCLIRDLGPKCDVPDWPAIDLINDNDIGAIATDGRGNLWMAAAPTGLIRIRPDGSDHELFTTINSNLPSRRIESLLLDARDRLWVGTDRGVVRFDDTCRCFVAPRALGRSPDQIKQLALSMLEDASGGLWIGYFNLGLERIALDGNGIRHYLPSSFSAESRAADRIRAILPIDDNTYWIGTFGDGVHALQTDGNTGLMRSFERLFPIDRLNEGQRQVWSLVRHDHTLYVGTDAGLFRFDTASKRLDEIRVGGIRQVVRHMVVDTPRQLLWIGSETGLCRYSLTDETSRCLDADETTEGRLSNRFVFAVHVDRVGNVWAGTWNGLDRIDPDALRATPVPVIETGISSGLIYDIAESRDGQLWIGSSDGLVRFTPGAPAEVFRERQGLSNRVIYGIEPDRDDVLWLSSVRGVMRFDPRSRTVSAYDQRDGLQGNEFLFGAHARDGADRVLFAGINGLNRIEPGRVPRTLAAPRVHFTHLSVLGQPLSATQHDTTMPTLDAAPGYVDHIRLGPKHNMLGIEFAAPDFDQPGLLRFEYQLDGFDPRWIDLDNRRFVSFTNLAPGDYRLSIRARNRFGEASLDPARMLISVTPPIHATWWFRMIVVMLTVAVAWMIYLWRTRDLRHQRVVLEHEVVRQTEEVRTQNQRLAEQQSELERANRELFQLSNRDALTGAYNRRYIQERLSRAVASNDPLAVAILDIDYFKRINDRHGHLAGDDCLRHVVACMSEVVGDRAEFARWGGEEFLILIHGPATPDAPELLERLRQRIASRPAIAGAETIALTASIGWQSTIEGHRAPMAEMIRAADEALYAAKAQGRDRVVRAPSDPSTRV